MEQMERAIDRFEIEGNALARKSAALLFPGRVLTAPSRPKHS